MSFKDRLAFFQNIVSQQNSNSPSNPVSQGSPKPQPAQGVKSSPYQSRNTTNNNKQSSTTSTPQKPVQQNKEILKSSPLETKKEDPKPSQKPVAGGGIASKMAFFNNQANSQNISTKSPQTKETPKPTPKIEEPKKDTVKPKTEEPKPTPKITETKNNISNPKLIQEDSKKQTVITKTVEIKKEDTKPVQKSAASSGFAAKMAFFNNQINSQSKPPQIKETSTFTKTKIDETTAPTSKAVDIKKETSNFTKTKIDETSTKKSPEVKQETAKITQKSSPSSTTNSSSGGGGFAAKMAFFNNQINSQSKPPQIKETTTSKPKINETKKETSTVAKPKTNETKKETSNITNTKINETSSNKSSEMKSETQKQPTSTSSASSTSNSSGFASKMAFFKNQTNQGSATNEPPVQQSKPPSKFSDRLAMFNNMNQPIGRSLEHRGGSQASSNDGYRSKRSQTLMQQSTPTMMKDSIAVTIANDDTCIDTPPQGIAVRRKVRGATTRRRPTLLPDE